MKKQTLIWLTIAFIFLVALIFAVTNIVQHAQHEKLRKSLCSQSNELPSWFVNHEETGGKIAYAFSGYSATTQDVVVDGVLKYNYREATKEELTNRFIGNKYYFVYTENNVSLKQIEAFKKSGFWNVYQSSRTTFKC